MKRLPILCHYCGLLRHELQFCAQYFSETKSGAEGECGYGDWLKALGGRTRSPQKREVRKDDELPVPLDGDRVERIEPLPGRRVDRKSVV